MISTSNENSYSDKIAKLILKFKNNKKFILLERGSDERQFNSPISFACSNFNENQIFRI